MKGINPFMRSYFGIHNHNQVNRIQSVNLRKTRLLDSYIYYKESTMEVFNGD